MYGQISINTIELLGQERHQELLREARQHRLAVSARVARLPVWSRAARGLGRGLVAAGQWLIARPSRQTCAD